MGEEGRTGYRRAELATRDPAQSAGQETIRDGLEGATTPAVDKMQVSRREGREVKQIDDRRQR